MAELNRWIKSEREAGSSLVETLAALLKRPALYHDDAIANISFLIMIPCYRRPPSPSQAVVLADSFAIKFRPCTAERPKVLMSLVNMPMLDYTMEWLAWNGVDEVRRGG